MNDVTPRRKSRSDLEQERAAWRDMAPAVGLLAIALGVGFFVDAGHPTWWNLPWSGIQLVGAALLMRAEVRKFRRADEYQRVQQLEALAFGFAVVLLLMLAGGLLETAGVGDARQWLQISFIGGILAWAGAVAIKAWKA